MLKKRYFLPLVMVFMFLLLSCEKKQNVTLNTPDEFHYTSAESCKNCHESIYKQWSGSMHASSTALKDPIHGMVYESVMGDPHKEGVNKNGKYPVCLQCHAPVAAMDGKTKLDDKEIYNEGVNCTVCHTIKKYKGSKNPEGKMQYGIKAYDFSIAERTLQGPSGRSHHNQPDGLTQNYHPIPIEPNAAVLKTNDVCMGCHQRRNNGNGAPVCNTGEEYEKSGSKVTCQSCHMPVVDGMVDHSMIGGHSKKMLSRGLRMEMDGNKTSNGIDVKMVLHNQLPHKFPTAAPFRNFFIRIFALDRNGKVVWVNFKNHPSKDDPDSFFHMAMEDDSGKIVPPPKATKIKFDKRLEPFESRELIYHIPVSDAALIRAEAYYSLLKPDQIKNNRDRLDEDLVKVKLITTAEIRFPQG